jgi:hypothetical protein
MKARGLPGCAGLRYAWVRGPPVCLCTRPLAPLKPLITVIEVVDEGQRPAWVRGLLARLCGRQLAHISWRSRPP